MTVRDILTFVVKLMIACPIVYFFACAIIDYRHRQQMKILTAIPKLLSTIHLRQTVVEEIKEDPQEEQPV